ncbi:hypothetical protein [Paraburkholderia sp.]|uniref:hypothetical protein n=1 Tax=Paraburkholderia sp. TaxID=1926495 RepID=UPI003D6E4454
MKTFLASALAVVIAATCLATSVAALAQDAPTRQCAIGTVTGVGGAAQSMRDYLAAPSRDRYRLVNENPIQCQVSDDGHASACTGLENLRNERVSVYDDIDATTMSVVARIELDHGQTYPVIIVVQKKDVRCEESGE